MKQTLFTFLITALSSVALQAQQNEGVILFEERVRSQGAVRKDNVAKNASKPEYYIFKSELLFNQTECLYRSTENLSSGKTSTAVRNASSHYQNFKTGRLLNQIYWLDQQFLIEEDICVPSWSLTNETQTILGYSCRLATLTDTFPDGRVMQLRAWFASELPHGIGPKTYGQLPGTILKVDFNQDEQIWIATKIEFRKLKKKEMKPPKQGKKITWEEYRAMFK